MTALPLIQVTDDVDDVLAAQYNALLAPFSLLQPGGRLTLTTAVPVTTSDVTGATTVYYTPYVTDRVPLWDGTFWQPITFTEKSLALGTITAALPYDVFGYASSGDLALEKLAWTSGTARATAISIQGGRYCKTGDKTRLYLGTFYTTATTTTEDSAARRYLWNMYNRCPRTLYCSDATNTWAYTTATIRAANNDTTDGTGRVAFLLGLAEDAVSAQSVIEFANTNTGVGVGGGIGLDVTNAITGLKPWTTTALANGYITFTAAYSGFPAVGVHFLQRVEYSTATGTTTWLGDGGAATLNQSGMTGTVRA